MTHHDIEMAGHKASHIATSDEEFVAPKAHKVSVSESVHSGTAAADENVPYHRRAKYALLSALGYKTGTSVSVLPPLARDEWDSKLEYMLSVIGYVVDLGNCIRFPYVTYKNGGGAFLVPYFFFLILVGVPMMYLEMAVGQYFRVGNISLWGKVNVYAKGIGYASLLVVAYITLYYTTMISYAFFYLFASFRAKVPWSDCGNSWNTAQCHERIIDMYTNGSMMLSSNNNLTNTSVSPSEEYYNRYVLGIHNSSGEKN